MDLIKQRKLKLLATSAEWKTEDSSRPRYARNGERQQAMRKTGKEVVRRHCRLVWMLTSRGSSAGKRPTIVEKSHWPQRLTWAMS